MFKSAAASAYCIYNNYYLTNSKSGDRHNIIMSHGWYSKKDVIHDLTTATGKSVCDLNEEYVILGQKPPPPCHLADEEEEMQISTLCGERNPSSDTVIGKPDLMGITQMIRMVDQFYERPPIESRPGDDNRLATNTVISISKLNPDVEEFVPQNDANKKPPNKLNIVGVSCTQEDFINKNDEAVKGDKNKIDVKIDKGVEQLNNPKSINNIKEIKNIDNCHSNSSGCIDVSRLTPLEMQEMREKLKTKISGTSNTNCVKLKRERNLAIATLVKLHCKPPNAAVSGEEKFELKAPDYYQRSLSTHEKDSKRESIKQSNIMSDAAFDDSVVIKKQLGHENHELTVGSNTNTKCVANETNTIFKGLDDDKNAQKEPSQCETSPIEENSGVITKEVRESIVKVENWFNSPSKKQKEPSFYLGPVTFKRKVCSKPMSPISISSENSSVQKSETFVPSEFANQLSQKYMERSKARQIEEPDIWMKIESELKARDKKIKKQAHVIV